VLVLKEKGSLPHFRSLYGPGALATHHAFVYGLHEAFLFSFPIALLAFFLSFQLKELALRTSSA